MRAVFEQCHRLDVRECPDSKVWSERGEGDIEVKGSGETGKMAKKKEVPKNGKKDDKAVSQERVQRESTCVYVRVC